MENFDALGRGTVLAIPNGVPDIGDPEPPTVRPNNSLIVGSVGRLDLMKAYDRLLLAQPLQEIGSGSS